MDDFMMSLLIELRKIFPVQDEASNRYVFKLVSLVPAGAWQMARLFERGDNGSPVGTRRMMPPFIPAYRSLPNIGKVLFYRC
jgi:hypothetical protein